MLEKKGKALRDVLSFGSKSDATMTHWKKWRGVEQDFINYLGDIIGPPCGSRVPFALIQWGWCSPSENITSIHGIVWICWTFLVRENTTRAVSHLWRHGCKHIPVHRVIALRFLTSGRQRCYSEQYERKSDCTVCVCEVLLSQTWKCCLDVELLHPHSIICRKSLCPPLCCLHSFVSCGGQ